MYPSNRGANAMSEKPETVHVVLRGHVTGGKPGTGYKIRHAADKPVKVADDRADARAYAKRMNSRAKAYHYVVRSCAKL
jgi:hypothetical protein